MTREHHRVVTADGATHEADTLILGTGFRVLDNREMQRKARPSVWNSGGCASWYLDAEGRNGSIWPDHTFRFVRRTRRFDPTSYEVSG